MIYQNVRYHFYHLTVLIIINHNDYHHPHMSIILITIIITIIIIFITSTVTFYHLYAVNSAYITIIITTIGNLNERWSLKVFQWLSIRQIYLENLMISDLFGSTNRSTRHQKKASLDILLMIKYCKGIYTIIYASSSYCLTV